MIFTYKPWPQENGSATRFTSRLITLRLLSLVGTSLILILTSIYFFGVALVTQYYLRRVSQVSKHCGSTTTPPCQRGCMHLSAGRRSVQPWQAFIGRSAGGLPKWGSLNLHEKNRFDPGLGRRNGISGKCARIEG